MVADTERRAMTAAAAIVTTSFAMRMPSTKTTSSKALAAALQLRLYAVDLSTDDFGAGYSSLARLRDLPFSELKLDRGFVDGCASDSRKLAIGKSAVTLGAALGCTTVAEGIETEEDLVALRDLGCQLVQGFRFAGPMTFEALKLFLAGPVVDGAA